jgi:hypothetical protein
VPTLSAKLGSNGRRSSCCREVVGEEAPSATATHHVEDSVEDLTQGVHPRASGSSGSGKMGLYAGPLGVGEVGLWYALLIMPGILPGHRFRTPFQTVSHSGFQCD